MSGGYPWTPVEDELLRGLPKGWPAPKIPNRSVGAVIKRREYLRKREGHIDIEVMPPEEAAEAPTRDDLPHGRTIPAPPPAPEWRRLGAYTNRDIELEELCDRLEKPPGKVRELISEAAAHGVNIHLVGDTVGRAPITPRAGETSHPIAQSGSRHMFCVVGDPHVGSNYFMRAQLSDFIDKVMARASARGVGSVLALTAGDILDGVYRFSRFEQYAQGFEQQAAAAADGDLPARPGLEWIGISGNHDETFQEQSGMLTHRALPEAFRSRGRTDLTMLGARGAYLRLKGACPRGLLVELWHPKGSPAYAISYKLQKKIEGYAPGQKPDMLFTGHYHQHNYSEIRGVHAFLTGCWQGGGSSFGKSIGTAPSIGSWIVEYAQTPQGAVRDVNVEWVSYHEVETIREVGLG